MANNRFIMLHRDEFVKTVEQALRTTCGVREGDALLLAVSGGADSVALLRAIAVIAERPHWRLRPHVAHVHHHLRPEADGDAKFVADLAAGLNLPFELAHVRPDAQAGNLENAARRLRYEALEKIARDAAAPTVATAHHADDQLETMLMRLIRGASVRGLGAIAPRRRLDPHTRLIRPMLRCDHAAAVTFLQRLDQPWREDASNAERSRWRAKLRAEVLPALRELRADAAMKAADTADRLRDAARLVDDRIQRAMADAVTREGRGGWSMHREDARAMPLALLRGLLRTLLIDSGARPDALGRRAIEPLVRVTRDRSGELRRFTFAGGVEVTIEARRLIGRPAGRSGEDPADP